MLTDEQIRTLNRARTILNSLKTPNTREGGHADAIYGEASNAVFQALNVTRAYIGQPISDDQMHNRTPTGSTCPLGTADEISVVGDESGFELHFTTEQGSYAINVQDVAEDLLTEANHQIGEWIGERESARATRPVTDDADAYPADDPKSPGWHSTHVDLWEFRSGK